MARITVEDCLRTVGSENRFALIQLALTRLRQHRQGLPYLVEGKNKEVVMTLREIAAGVVTHKNINEFTAKPRHQAPEPPPIEETASPLEAEATIEVEAAVEAVVDAPVVAEAAVEAVAEAGAAVDVEATAAQPVAPATQTEES